MTFVRSVFVFALVMLVVGMLASRIMLQNIFGSSAVPLATVTLEQSSHPTSTPHPPAAAGPVQHPRVLGKQTASGTVASIHKHVVSAHRAKSPSNPASLQRVPARISSTPTPAPLPSPTNGTVSLARYWVNQTAARHGNTVALGYVISNQTGHTMRVMLGASLKSSRALSWAAQSLSDPSHDVVAVVPPGVSLHTRFFTLPSRLHPGVYDVAWGLRNASSGRRAGLVAAPSALSVVR